MEKLYTVDDIAIMTALTTRTIRNYLKQGMLTGRKIGGQWRFTNVDIKDFMDRGRVGTEMEKKQKQSVVDFIDQVNTEISTKVSVCTIVDIYESVDEAKSKSDKLCKFISEMVNNEYLRYSYNYVVVERKARFVLIGTMEFIVKALEILN